MQKASNQNIKLCLFHEPGDSSDRIALPNMATYFDNRLVERKLKPLEQLCVSV